MKFKEYYEKMGPDDIERLNSEWGFIESTVRSKTYLEDNALKSWIKNEGFRKAIIDEEFDKFIGKKAREYLKYKVLGYDLFDYEIEQCLRKKYIIVENEILDDLVIIMIEYIRSLSMTIIDDEPVEVILTPFLQLILMVNYVYSNNLEIDNMFERANIEGGIISRETFIEYLSIRQLLTYDKKYINADKLPKWINDKTKSVQDFYKFITVQINAKGIFDFFNIIIKAFNNSDDWVAIKEFEKIFKEFEKEVDTGIRLGLIILKEYEKKLYMQFSPEGWFLAMGKRPNLWNKKEILITPLKEVFIPFNFDPFVIQKFDYFDCSSTDENSRTKVYCDDYFIVSKICETRRTNELMDVTELSRYIEELCEDIPDVVRYEIIRDK